MKTSEQLKEQAKKIGLEFWKVNSCSMCGYDCGYVIRGENVGYDTGCDCTYGRGGIEPRTWENLAGTYNMNQPENNPKISAEYLKELNEIWKF